MKAQVTYVEVRNGGNTVTSPRPIDFEVAGGDNGETLKKAINQWRVTESRLRNCRIVITGIVSPEVVFDIASAEVTWMSSRGSQVP